MRDAGLVLVVLCAPACGRLVEPPPNTGYRRNEPIACESSYATPNTHVALTTILAAGSAAALIVASAPRSGSDEVAPDVAGKVLLGSVGVVAGFGAFFQGLRIPQGYAAVSECRSLIDNRAKAERAEATELKQQEQQAAEEERIRAAEAERDRRCGVECYDTKGEPREGPAQPTDSPPDEATRPGPTPWDGKTPVPALKPEQLEPDETPAKSQPE